MLKKSTFLASFGDSRGTSARSIRFGRMQPRRRNFPKKLIFAFRITFHGQYMGDVLQSPRLMISASVAG
jgi:hypothetical protein